MIDLTITHERHQTTVTSPQRPGRKLVLLSNGVVLFSHEGQHCGYGEVRTPRRCIGDADMGFLLRTKNDEAGFSVTNSDYADFHKHKAARP